MPFRMSYPVATHLSLSRLLHSDGLTGFKMVMNLGRLRKDNRPTLRSGAVPMPYRTEARSALLRDCDTQRTAAALIFPNMATPSGKYDAIAKCVGSHSLVPVV